MNPKESFTYFHQLQQEMFQTLATMVEIESPTTDKPSVDRFGRHVADLFTRLGMNTQIVATDKRGDHVIARSGSQKNKVLILCHLDTVWELGTLARMPVRVEGDVARGPGIFDMKGGIVVTLYALKLLHEQNRARNITVVFNSDEEEGSESSRELIETEARDAQCAYILEPAGPKNALKTKRRGTGDFRVTALGRAAHAGVEPEKGINAITELSHQLLEIQTWNGLRKGISANVGLIHGGTRANVIPERAEAVVDVRCDSLEDKAWLEQQFKTLHPKLPGAKLDITGGFERPPLERTEKVLSLYEEAAAIAAEFDYSVREFWTGGGSDGNFTAALGIPTLDGLGPEGEGAHAETEHILVSSLPRRANLLYQLLLKRTAQ
jgi:glutamate carboxypeptidase